MTDGAGRHTDELTRLLREVEKAKYGDSNDREIELLGDALDEALCLLGVERPTLTDEEIRAAGGLA